VNRFRKQDRLGTSLVLGGRFQNLRHLSLMQV